MYKFCIASREIVDEGPPHFEEDAFCALDEWIGPGNWFSCSCDYGTCRDKRKKLLIKHTQKWPFIVRDKWRTYASFTLAHNVMRMTSACQPAANDFWPLTATLHYVLSKQVLPFVSTLWPDRNSKNHQWSKTDFQMWYQYFILSNHSLLRHYYQSHWPSFHS